MWLGGEVALEIDKFNFVANIMGVDSLESVRRDLGGE
jgi:phage tail tube protein FII